MKKPQNPYPNTEVLGAMIRASDTRAIRYVIAELKAAGGSMVGAAKAIGITDRNLYFWRDASPALAAQIAKHGLGREGAGRNATRARVEAAEAAEKPKRKAKAAAARSP